MFKLIIAIFICLLFILYFFVDIDNKLYYLNIKITLFSLFSALIIHVFLIKFPKLKKSLTKYFIFINKFTDKYGIYLMLFVFFIFINFITFTKHLNYFSSGFDLGIFNQVIYKYSNFEFPASSSIREISNIEADHFHPILLLYGLIYKIIASPLVLIFIQNLFFTIGGLGIYKISQYKLKIPLIGLGLVFLYLIFKGNLNALLFDFHPIVVAVSLFPWLFYFSLKKDWLKYFLLLIPILLSKENLSIYIIFFGIYQFLIQRERYIGLASILIGCIYFYLVMNYFLPVMGGGGKYWSYGALGANPKELIINTFAHPLTFLSIIFGSIIKIITYLHHLGSGLYLAIFSPVIILLIPSYAQKFLSSREEFWTMGFHYSIDVYWVIAIGVIFTLALIKKKYNKKSSSIILILFLFIFINSTLINLYKTPLLKTGYYLENKTTMEEIIQLLPNNPSLSTQNKLIPHFSHNDEIYIFPNLGNAEYILLNDKISSGWPLTSDKNLDFYIKKLKNKKEFINIKLPFIKKALNFNNKYELIIEKDGVYLFKLISN